MGLNPYAAALALYRSASSTGVTLSLHGSRARLSGSAAAKELRPAVAALLGPENARAGSVGLAALRAVLEAPGEAERDVLAAAVFHLVGPPPLPLPFTVRFGAGVGVWAWTTSGAAYKALLAEGVPTVVSREVEALAHAVELGRAGPDDLARYLQAKAKQPQWVLTREVAGVVDVAAARDARPTLCVGEMLRGLGSRVVKVEMYKRKA